MNIQPYMRRGNALQTTGLTSLLGLGAYQLGKLIKDEMPGMIKATAKSAGAKVIEVAGKVRSSKRKRRLNRLTKLAKSRTARMTRNVVPDVDSRIGEIVAPVSVNEAFTSNYVGFKGRAQLNIDQPPSNPNDCARIEFSVWTPWQLVPASASSTALLWSSGALPSGTGNTIVFISPANLSSRLATFSRIFQRYAFRELEFCMVTQKGTNINGNYGVSVVNNLQSLTNAAVAVAPQLTSVVMDYDPAVLSPLYSNQCIKFRDNGTKTWTTVLSASSGPTPYDPIDSLGTAEAQSFQIGLYGAGACPVDSTQAPISQLMVKGIIDYYCMQPVTTGNPALDIVDEKGNWVPIQDTWVEHLKERSLQWRKFKQEQASDCHSSFDDQDFLDRKRYLASLMNEPTPNPQKTKDPSSFEFVRSTSARS